MPTTKQKPAQFAFVLTAEEHRMLGELAEWGYMTRAALIRSWIRDKHRKRKKT
jgi:hypothetical protein